MAKVNLFENALDIIEARQWPESSETYFKLKTENFVFEFFNLFRKILACSSITTRSTQRRLLVLFVAAKVGIQSFSAMWD